MRITFELETDDVERLYAALARSRRKTECADEVDIIDAAKYALDHLGVSRVPAYIRKHLVKVQQLIVMLEDDAWALPEADRRDVVETLAYFSDPDDLIPDDIEVIGLLDDAIMLELLLRRSRGLFECYAEFCDYRASLVKESGAEARRARARLLAERRAELLAKLRRKRKRVRKN